MISAEFILDTLRKVERSRPTEIDDYQMIHRVVAALATAPAHIVSVKLDAKTTHLEISRMKHREWTCWVWQSSPRKGQKEAVSLHINELPSSFTELDWSGYE